MLNFGNMKSKISSLISDIRTSKTSLISTALILMLILGFTISSFMGSKSDDGSWVFKIGNDHVSRIDFEKDLRKLEKMEQNFGKTDQEMKLMALNMLAVEKATNKELEKYGIKIDNDMVISIIKKDENFMKDGKFQKELFKNFLSQRNIAEEDFLHYMKSKIASQIALSFGEGFISDDQDIAKIIEKSRNQKRKFEVYSVKLSDIKVDLKITDDEKSKFYNENRDLFKHPMRKKISYINGIDMKNKISYNPPIESISSIAQTRKDLTGKEIGEFLTKSYVCQVLGSASKQVNSYEAMENLAESYGVKIYEKELIFDDKIYKTKYRSAAQLNKGDIGFASDRGAECYDFEMLFVSDNNDKNYKTFDESRSQIEKEILKNRRLARIEEIKKEVSKANDESINKNAGLSVISSNGFKKTETKESIRKSEIIGKNGKIIEGVFTMKRGEVSDLVEHDEIYYAARVLEIIDFDGVLNDMSVKKLAQEIHNSKLSDVYKLYYMQLQKRYNIEINTGYFKTDVIR